MSTKSTIFFFTTLLFSITSFAEGNTLGIQLAKDSKFGIYFASKESEKYGWYFDFLFSLPRTKESSVYDFNSNYAENVLGDTYMGAKKDTFSMSVGRTFGITENLNAFASLGFGTESKYREYSDQYGILGEGGKYFIKDGNSSTISTHLGAILFLEKLSLKVGYESFHKEVTFGIGAIF